MNTKIKKKVVLIVEDDVTLREAVATALADADFEVHTAEDGEIGLSAALKLQPDLILLDLMMPKLDGIAVLKRLRDDSWGKDAQVIVLTAVDDLSKIAEVVQAGGNDYITKTNITLEEIVRRVRAKIG